MAEGWARALHGNQFEVYSAGIEKHGLNPYAVQVMKEAGVDISNHSSQKVEELPTKEFDLVITVCGHANETCPLFTGKTVIIHHGFDDPPKLAKEAKTQEEAIGHYRRVCQEIKTFAATLPSFFREQTLS